VIIVKVVGSQDIDNAAALAVGLHQVGDIQHRFPEKLFATLLFQG